MEKLSTDFPTPLERWWRVQVAPQALQGIPEELETIAFDLVELGATTTSIDDRPSIHCFIEGSEDRAKDFLAEVLDRGLMLVSFTEVEPENWNDRCAELWEPVIAGSLTVIPVSSPEDARPCGENAIKIIPGEGFGTGHHATTRMILEELVALKDQNYAPTRILDVGTGSGVLAIAAAKLFAASLTAPIEANDIDLHALRNAADNVALNGSGETIRLSTDTVDTFTPSFDLILGNLYGEVLVTLAPLLSSVAHMGTVAILSGITELVRDPVFEAYAGTGSWELIQERSEGHWVCLVIRRI